MQLTCSTCTVRFFIYLIHYTLLVPIHEPQNGQPIQNAGYHVIHSYAQYSLSRPKGEYLL